MKIPLVVLLLIALFSCDPNRHHIVKEHHDNGNLKFEVEFKGNKPNGYGKQYYPDGKLKTTLNFKDGKRHGKSFTYNESGKIEIEQNYKDDSLDGKMFEYFENGEKLGETFWRNGKVLTGATFKENGDTASFREGSKVVGMHSKGKIALINCMEGNGKVSGTIRFDEKNKIVKYEGPLTCLTKRDSVLLDLQNKAWRNLKHNF